jgi:DivIVA domain-containing protein
MSSSIDPGTTPARRVAMARVKRATSQLVRWHSEYEDALTEAHDLGVPDRALADAGAPQIPARSSPRTPTAPNRNPGGHTSPVVEDERSQDRSGDGESMPGAPQQRPAYGELRDHVPAEIRDASFPTAVRGYDRRAVDAYIKRVNRVIAELEVSRSPQAAVRNALDRVGTQTSGILQRARETAEEITTAAGAEAEETTARAKAEADEIKASARAKADETTARAQVEAEETTGRTKTEAEEILARSQSEAAELLQRAKEEVEALREQADTRMRKLSADTEAIRQERQLIVDEIRQLAGRLEELAGGATQPRAATREEGEDESPEEQ